MATKTATTTAVNKTVKVKPIPTGYHAITPYLIFDGAARAIDFYQRAFDAKELLRIPAPNDRIGHAEIKVGDSVIMMADEHPEMDAYAPKHFGGSPVSLLLYVTDVDAMFKQAIAAGAIEVRPVADQFYGDRTGGIRDPFGHRWYVATHVEDVPPEELEKRAKAARG